MQTQSRSKNMVNKVLMRRFQACHTCSVGGRGWGSTPSIIGNVPLAIERDWEYMLSGNALRHQIILPQQQQFYDYWRSKCRAGSFPSRAEILPEEIHKQLPMTTIMERVAPTSEGGKHRYRHRLAGTGFWALYNKEIQGSHLDELPIGCRVEYWHRVLDQVIETRKPLVGVTRPNTPNGSHLAQFWVRLPLSENGTDINMILGFDHLVKMSEVPAITSAPEKIYA